MKRLNLNIRRTLPVKNFAYNPTGPFFKINLVPSTLLSLHNCQTGRQIIIMPSLVVVSIDAIDNTFDSQQAHNDCNNSDSSSDMEAPARKKLRMTTMTTTRPRARAPDPRESDDAGGDKERARNFVT